MSGVNFTKPLSCEQSLCVHLLLTLFQAPFATLCSPDFPGIFLFLCQFFRCVFSVLFSAVGSPVCFPLALQDIAFLVKQDLGL